MKNSTYIKYLVKKSVSSNFTQDLIMSYKFKKRLGRTMNLKNPILFNDKLHWLKYNDRDLRLVEYADKYKVRPYVAEKIGSKYLNDIFDVYTDPNLIQFDKLPNQYVLKANHASGFNLIVKDNSKLDKEKVRRDLNRWLKIDYSLGNKEWHYGKIDRKIICEKYIPELSNHNVLDYRVFCFNGEPKLIAVDSCMEKKDENKRDIYDLEWRKLNVSMTYDNSDIIHEKPSSLDELVHCARLLADDFPFVRVDFYIIDNRLVFSELTFIHGSGTSIIRPVEFEKIMGDWLELR